MRFLIALILLAFPFAELYLLYELSNIYGWWVLFYLVVVFYLGLQLIRDEKQSIPTKLMHSFSPENMAAGSNPVKALLGSARNMVAGVLLMIPGVISDVIAVIFLLIPIQQPKVSPQNNQENVSANNRQSTNAQYQGGHHAANDDVIVGEYVEIKEDGEK
jgi:UPF0716 protein FxsA